MKKKLIAMFCICVCMSATAASVYAEKQTYTPPAKKGTIYVVVRYKAYDSKVLYPKTTVSVKWGSYSRSKSYGTAFTLKTAGVVISLKHTKDDAVPLTVETDGRIVSIKQLDSAPSESNSGNYKNESW